MDFACSACKNASFPFLRFGEDRIFPRAAEISPRPYCPSLYAPESAFASAFSQEFPIAIREFSMKFLSRDRCQAALLHQPLNDLNVGFYKRINKIDRLLGCYLFCFRIIFSIILRLPTFLLSLPKQLWKNLLF